MRRENAAGLTLVELLVVLAVLGVMSALAFSGLLRVMEIRERSDTRLASLGVLQQALADLGHRTLQVRDRPIRDQHGRLRPALVGGPDTEGWLLELTHAAGTAAEPPQRAAYRLAGGRLVHRTWSVLDRAQGSESHDEVLLDDVTASSIRFLDGDRVWHDSWPPLPSHTRSLPLAVDLRLSTSRWKDVRRLFPVTGADATGRGPRRGAPRHEPVLDAGAQLASRSLGQASRRVVREPVL